MWDVVSKALSLLGVEGVYVLQKEGERYRVVAAGGSAAGARGLYLPRDWELREGPTNPPGPLGFSPDGTSRAGFVALGKNHALALEGTFVLSQERRELIKLWVDLLDREFRMRQSLETLLAVGRQLRNGRLPEEVVAQVLEALLRFGGWDLAMVLRRHEGTFVPWVRVGALDFALSHEEVRSLQELLKEAVGRAEAPDIPWVVQDVQAILPYFPALGRLGVQTVAVFFLGEGTPASVFGALILASLNRFPHFSPETLLLLQIAKEGLESWLRKTWYAEGLLRAFARVMEVLDCETHGHMERVSRLAVALGRVVGVKDLHGLYVGAYLHDLGKLFLPQELLQKNGPLLTQEWIQVKTHPEAGYEVLSSIPFLSPTALNVVLHHHEHWDGTGYPRGLRGEAIPLEARVFAVVDVWDALISRRPYKPAWACLVNCLVPRRGREKGEKNPKAVGDELQKRPRHGRPRLPLPKVPPTQPRLHPPKHPLHHPAKPVHLGVPPLPRPHPRLLPGLAPAPKPDHRPHPRLPQNPPHLLPVKPRVRQKPPSGRRKPPQHLPPKPGVRGVALPHHSTPGPQEPPLPIPPHQGQKPRVPPHPPHLLPPTKAEKPVLAPVGQPRGVHEVEGGKAPPGVPAPRPKPLRLPARTPGRDGPPVPGKASPGGPQGVWGPGA